MWDVRYCLWEIEFATLIQIMRNDVEKNYIKWQCVLQFHKFICYDPAILLGIYEIEMLLGTQRRTRMIITSLFVNICKLETIQTSIST